MSVTVDQVLATLGVDSASIVAVSGQYVIIRRDPEPGDESVGVDTGIDFWLVDLDTDPTDGGFPWTVPDFCLHIEGAEALSISGGVQTWSDPWTGSITGSIVSDPFVFWTFELTQVPLLSPVFTSEQEVNMEAWLQASPVTPPPDFEWSFVCEDIIPPVIVSAWAVEADVIRVAFDDGMSLSGAGSVLDPNAWSITRHNIDPYPGVNLEVVSVEEYDPAVQPSQDAAWTFADAAERTASVTASFNELELGFLAYQVSDSSWWRLDALGSLPTDPVSWIEVQVASSYYDVAINWEMTPGCRYRIAVSSVVEDDAGNPIDATFLFVPFDGFTPDIPAGRLFSHWRQMVPLKNREEDATRDAERVSLIIQELTNLLLAEVDFFTDLYDPDRCSDAVIDLMLYDMGNPFADWADLELNENEKRKLLRILVDIYRSKGTDQGIEQTVLFMLGKTVRVVEYALDGWILGVDELGSGDIPYIDSIVSGTFNISALPTPRDLSFSVDGGPEQTVTIDPGDFADPANGTIPELVDILNANLAGATAYVTAAGSPGFLLSGSGPFAINGGDTLELTVNGDVRTIKFYDSDFETPGSATAEEVAGRIGAECPDLFSMKHPYIGAVEMVMVMTLERGSTATLSQTGGTAAISFSGPNGVDGESFAIQSDTEPWSAAIAGGEASIACTNYTELMPTVFGLAYHPSASAGGSILAPSDAYTLYSFDIEYDGTLTDEEISIIRKVAEYMKPAHTHLIKIRPPLERQEIEGWELGVDQLDLSAELTQ